MGYYIDLAQISIQEYRKKLELAYLPPSRMILKDKLPERFAYFEQLGIQNIKELIQILKKKDRFAELSSVDCLSGDYLTILLRELNSIHPKPNKLADCTWISASTIEALAKKGISNTEKLYEMVKTKPDRQALANETGIDYTEILALSKLCDLSRIKWVGVTYARVLYDLEVDTVAKVSQSNPIDLHARINERIKEHRIFKGSIGLNDVHILIETAKEVPAEIEW